MTILYKEIKDISDYNVIYCNEYLILHKESHYHFYGYNLAIRLSFLIGIKTKIVLQNFVFHKFVYLLIAVKEIHGLDIIILKDV